MPNNRQRTIIERVRNSIFLDPDYKQFLLEFVKSTPAKYLGSFEKYIRSLDKEQKQFMKNVVKKNPDFLGEFELLKNKKTTKNIRKKEATDRKKEGEILSKLEEELK